MLAARDQENLVHNHRTTAASKPLNQVSRNGPPKTPAPRAPKTPFKIPLNDENAAGAFGAGKSALKTTTKGKDNVLTGKKKGVGLDKSAFVTPMAVGNRAPLGLKTTNAKTKVFQTPAPPVALDGSNKNKEKSAQKSVSARRPKPRISHAQTIKLDVQDDETPLEEADEDEIEYMPPRPIDLPNFPEDFPPELDLSALKGENLTRGVFQTYNQDVDEFGESLFERRYVESRDKAFREQDEAEIRDFESMPLFGYDLAEFPDEENVLSQRKKQGAEERRKQADNATKPGLTQRKRLPLHKGPSNTVSTKAATLLSKQGNEASKPKAKLSGPTVKARLPATLVSRPKKVPQPTNPSPMRHTAAVASSNTTIGYSKGRTASHNLSKANDIFSKKPTSLAPSKASSRTAVPSTRSSGKDAPAPGERPNLQPFSSKYDDDNSGEPALGGATLADLLRDEEAEDDFELKW
ncbi:MAG: hypothetical protein M1833_006611 [Piccolia ochrophora]|nr:MAG: hypothetical protein M1833_006611 [Piccolia ochrophora]